MLSKSEVLIERGTTLLSQVKNSNRRESRPLLAEAEHCFEIALQFNPLEYKAMLALSEIYTWYDRLDKALHLCDEVIEYLGFDQRALHQRVLINIQIGKLDTAIRDLDILQKLNPHTDLYWRYRAMCLFQMSKIKEGWIYANKAFNFEILKIRYPGIPRWRGEDLTDKVVLLTMLDVRGGGDEIMFASVVPKIIKMAKICCIETEPRALSLFQTSFPDAIVFNKGEEPWIDREIEVDFHTWVREQAAHHLNAEILFPKQGGYLKVDHSELNEWRSRIDALGRGTLKVGICWTSLSSVGPNIPCCSRLVDWGAIFTLPNTTFINLHDLDGADEVAEAEEKFDVQIHSLNGANLLNRFDHVAAIAIACDVVISMPTTAAMIAGAVGANVFELRPAYTALCMDVLPWFPNHVRFYREWNETWEPTLEKVAAHLKRL